MATVSQKVPAKAASAKTGGLKLARETKVGKYVLQDLERQGVIRTKPIKRQADVTSRSNTRVGRSVAVDATRLRTGRRRTALAEDARTLRNEQFVDVALGVVRERFTEASHGGALLSELLGPPDVLADKIAAVVPESWSWTSTIGPVYRQASLATARGHSRQAVADLIKKRRVLALTTSDGHVVIPAFQLDSNLQPIRGLPEVLRILTSDVVDDWMLASWLTAPHHSLGGRSVVEHLAAGGDRSKAMSVAEAARQRWSA